MSNPSSFIRILCVDDQADLVELTSTFLQREREEFSVVTATSVDEGLDHLARSDFDAVVSDYQMPEKNGLDFLGVVREEYGDLPFILFTGKGSEEIASDAITAGVSDYLQKETGTDQYTVLANRVTNLVEKWQAEANLDTRIRQQETVADLGTRALAETDLTTLFDIAVRSVADALDNEYAKVLDWRPEHDDLKLVAGVGWRDGLVGEAAVGAGLDSQAGYTLQSEEPIIVNDLRTEERFSGPPLLHDHDVVSGISVIIGDIDAPWGVLGTHTTDRRTFTTDDVHFVQSIANVLANAIERVKRDQRNQAVFEEAFDAMVISDDDGRYTNVNSAACELFGADRSDLLGRSIDEFASDDFDFEHAWNQFQELEQERGMFSLVRPDGTTRLVEYAATTDIIPGEHLAVLRDVTEREQQRQSLEASEARYRTFTEDVLDTSHVGTFVLNSDFEVVWINAAIEEYFGLDRESIIGMDKRSVIEEHIKDVLADPEEFSDTVLATYEDNTYSEQFECRVLEGDAREERWLEHWSQPITSGLYAGGRIEHYTDLTERKELDAELESAIEQYQTLVEQNVAGIYIVRDREFEYVNPRFCDIFGYTEEELLSMDILDVVAPDTRETVVENIRKRMNGEIDAVEYTGTIERGDGEECQVRAHGTRIELDGSPAILGTVIDVTEQRELEQRIEHERALLEQVLDTSPVGITILDTEGHVQRANARAQAVLGLTKSEITTRTYDDPDWKIVDENGKRIPSHELPFARIIETSDPVFDYQHGIEWPDGTTRWLSVNAAPLKKPSGEIEQVIAVILDITDQREYEQRLQRQNERLEEFASIVSHDLRNPLNVLSGSLVLAEETNDPEKFENCRRAVERMERLVGDLLTLARNGEMVAEMESIDVGAITQECWRTVETAGATLTIETDQLIHADASRLRQLLENLIRNAIEHGGDHVTVTIGDLDTGFYIEDDGPGIAEDERAHVFESGYTTTRQGTGFGLSIVRQIADAHGWDVTITEGSDGGARFEITGVTIPEQKNIQ